MNAPEIPSPAAQLRRTRIVYGLLVVTGLLLLVVLIGFQISSIESSRLRPEYWADGVTTPSPLKPIPWITTLGTNIAIFAVLAILATWIAAITIGHRSFESSTWGWTSWNHPRSKTSEQPEMIITIGIFSVCSLFLLIFPALLFATMFWDAIHYIQQEESVWPRGTKLWWAGELSTEVTVEMVLLLPGSIFFAITTLVAGVRHCMRSQKFQIQHCRYFHRATFLGTLLLFIMWALYFAAVVIVTRHSSDHWHSISYANTPKAMHDGTTASVLYILASWAGLLGIWSLSTAALFELVIVDAIGLTIRKHSA